MSAYDNVVGGRLKLKGKALDVKAGGMKKKKKKVKKDYDQISQVTENELSAGEKWYREVHKFLCFYYYCSHLLIPPTPPSAFKL